MNSFSTLRLSIGWRPPSHFRTVKYLEERPFSCGGTNFMVSFNSNFPISSFRVSDEEISTNGGSASNLIAYPFVMMERTHLFIVMDFHIHVGTVAVK